MKKELERLQLVKCMEFIVRNLNDESIFDGWLYSGVADGDIPYGHVAIEPGDEENLDYYIEDDNFADLISLFLRLMTRARKSGGLYCGGIAAGEKEESEKPFGIVRWYNEDIESALREREAEPTEELTDRIRDRLERHWFTDHMIEAGWDYINNVVDEELRKENAK